MKKKVRAFLHNPLVIILPIVFAGLWGWQYYIHAVNAAPSAADNNLLPSGSFDEMHASTLPKGWTLQADATPTKLTKVTNGYQSQSALRMRVPQDPTGSVDVQTKAINVHNGGTYHAKTYYRSSVAFDVLVREHYAQGVSQLRFLRHYEPSSDWSTASAAVQWSAGMQRMQLVYRVADKGEVTLDGMFIERNDELRSLVTAPLAGARELVPRDGVFTVSPGSQLGVATSYRADAPARLIADYTRADGTTLSTSIMGLGAAREETLVEARLQVPAGARLLSLRIALQGEEGAFQAARQTLYDLTDKTKEPFAKPMVSLVIANGRKATAMVAPPLLTWSKYPATFYIDPDRLGQNGIADKRDMEILHQAGHELALYASADISVLSARTLERRLALQRGLLDEQWQLDQPALYAPYDQGDIGVRLQAMTYFSSRLSNQQGINTAQSTDLYALRTVKMDDTMTPDDLQQLLDETKAQKGWLILVYSGIEEGWGPAISPSAFAEHLELLQKSTLKVMTVQQALKAITVR
ncbi:MAG TPA: hypothetical protein VD735_04760 [Candidatus Saccharimonadales bacterium]|nr:hypothetical protein [Candidatus Saccharimonadales bacterium]